MTLTVLLSALLSAAPVVVDTMPARDLLLDLRTVPGVEEARLHVLIPETPARAFEHAQEHRVSVARTALIHGAMQLADAVSTEILLANGGYEQNPLLKDRAPRLLAKAVATGGLTALDVWLQRNAPGHGKWFRRVIVAVYGGVVVHNLVVAGR